MSAPLEAPGPALASLTTGEVGPQLYRLAVPMAFGLLSVMMFNVVDTWFVSLLGTKELAAISLTFPVVAVLGSLAMGLGIGTTSVLSRAIGRGQLDEVRRLTTDSLVLGALIVLPISVVGVATIDPLFRALGASAELLPLIHAYMRVWYLGTVFLVVPMVGMAAIRATGDTRTPAAVMAFAGLMNAALDPMFILGFGPIPRLGIQGAAIATVLARATTLAFALYMLGVRKQMLTSHPPGRAAVLASWRRILVIGGPAAATNVAQPVTIGILTALVASWGHEAVAAFGTGGRIEILAMIPIMGLGAGMAPFIGQNWGAGHKDRVAQSLRVAARAAAGLGLIGWLALALAAPYVAALFSDDPLVIKLIVVYLRVMPLAHGATGVFFQATSAFNAVGRPVAATSLTLLRTPALTVALAGTGALIAGLNGVFVGAAAAGLVSGGVAWVAVGGLRRAPPRMTS